MCQKNNFRLFILLLSLGIVFSIACAKQEKEEAVLLSGTPKALSINIAVGKSHTCAATSSQVSCWGKNDLGQLGRGKKTATPGAEEATPRPVTGIDGKGGAVHTVVTGTDHSCVLQGDRVKCWGSSESGKTGLSGDRTLPAIVDAFTAVPSKLFAGSKSTCTIWGNTDRVQCLGDNSYGHLAFSGVTVAASISVGSTHACLVKDSGLKCAGLNDLGQLGNETNNNSSALSGVVTLERAALVTDVSAGETHTCAISDGRVLCWGDNSSGQLGIGSLENQNIPKEVTLPGAATAISAGSKYTCAIVSERLYCWGKNDKGQLGDGTTSDRNSPTEISSIFNVQKVQTSGAGRHTCAVAEDSLYCWGDNETGQLGNSTFSSISKPELVKNLF